ncbi:tetratricopeptide repeat protein [Alphaproteobacteria bacterium]|nr:tetratricopeptide repeat protein [Alphaproteobacteria bacterium]
MDTLNHNNLLSKQSAASKFRECLDNTSHKLILDQLQEAFQKGDFQELVDKGEHYAKQNPHNFLFWHLLGRANLELGNFLSAGSHFNVAVRLNPGSANAHNWLGVALHRQRKLQLAVKSYIKAGSLDSKYSLAFYNLANAQREQGFFAKAIKNYSHVISIQKDHVDAYNNIGNAYKALGDTEKAIKYYLKAIELSPNYAGVYYNLGNALKNKGLFDKAAINYKKAISLNPNFANAHHMLAAVTGTKPSTAPKEYVKNLFDNYATSFEASLTKHLGYTIPQTITELILENSKEKALGSILDLGCGTGLVGLEISKFCTNLEGVDLSSSMLHHAKRKKIYNKLSCSDLVTYLSTQDLNFDYLISADVFVYLGELKEIFRLIRIKNQRKAKFVFSTEHTEREDFFLESSGRYSHSRGYIEMLCKTFDFKLSHFEKVQLRKEHGKFLVGAVYLLDF